MVALDTQEDRLSGASKDTTEARQPNIYCNLALEGQAGRPVTAGEPPRPGLWFDGDMLTARNQQTRQSIAPNAGLLLLSLLWALGAVRADLLQQFAANPSSRRFLMDTITLAFVAISATVRTLVRHHGWPQGSTAKVCVASGFGLFVVPAVLVHLASSRVPDLTRVAIFSLVPVFTVVLEPHTYPDREARGNRGLMAALAAVAGTLCIFPIELPRSLEAGCAFSALVLAAASAAAGNCWGVRAASETAQRSFVPCVAIMAATAALGLAGTTAFFERRERDWQDLETGIVWSAAVELPGLILLFWLMTRMTATRMSTRFLIAPLLANVAGLMVLRTRIGVRGWAGLLLIAAGSAWLLFASEEEPDANVLI